MCTHHDQHHYWTVAHSEYYFVCIRLQNDVVLYEGDTFSHLRDTCAVHAQIRIFHSLEYMSHCVHKHICMNLCMYPFDLRVGITSTVSFVALLSLHCRLL